MIDHYDVDVRFQDSMRLMTVFFSVGFIRSYLLAEDADIVVLTETMVNKEYQIVTAKNPFSPPLYPVRVDLTVVYSFF